VANASFDLTFKVKNLFFDRESGLTPKLRQRVKDLFTTAHQAEQDRSSQQVVKDIKATL
jgi:hypothetical protein